MRRIIVVLALLASTIGIGAAAPTAAAANCSTAANFTYKSGTTIYFAASIYNCSDVSAIKWIYYPSGGGNTTGWLDSSAGAWANGKIGATLGNGCYCDITKLNPGSSGGQMFVQQTCWWAGATRVIAGAFWWQIKGTASGQWGPPHSTIAANQNQYC